jgi:hypothetical protein
MRASGTPPQGQYLVYILFGYRNQSDTNQESSRVMGMPLPRAAEFMRCALGVLAVLEVLLIMIPVKPGVATEVR